VDGVGVELAGDAGFGLVFAEAEHAEALNEDDGGAGVAQGGRIGRGEGVVVVAVLLRYSSSEASICCLSAARSAPAGQGMKSGRILVRMKWSGQLVPRKARSLPWAELTNWSTSGASVKLRSSGSGADAAAQKRSDLVASLRRSARAGTASPPKRAAFGDSVALDELADLVDDGDGVEVALALGVCPR
jgi:hypothetical protein